MTETHRWFDERWYLLRNPDVARVGINALAHYWRYGESEGRFPSPWFDPPWYRAAYDLSPDQSPLEHFLAHRTTGRFLPCAALYLVPLTAPRGDDGAADPFDQYLTAMQMPERELLPEWALLRLSGLIEAAYHQINQADQYVAELDPVLHYCRFGWRLGWRPNSVFDPVWYGETNPRVTHLGINPLMHYILEGEAAHRRPAPWFDPAWYRAEHDVPPDHLALAHYLAHRHARAVSPNPLFDAAWYAARHGETIPPEIDPFSHYLTHGALEDIDPSPRFDARAWRRQHMAPREAAFQDQLPAAAGNPLVHYFRHLHENGSDGATNGRQGVIPSGRMPP